MPCDRVYTLLKIREAYLDCRKNKRNTINALKFEYEMEENLAALLRELRSGTYRPARTICFTVMDPKPREVFAADFRDRVVHHLLVRELESPWERRFIGDSCACRRGKGTHYGIRRLRMHIRKATCNHRNKAYYSQLDVSGFFMGIDKAVLYRLVREGVMKEDRSPEWKEEVLDLAGKIIFHDPTKNYVFRGDKRDLDLIPPGRSLFRAGKERGLPIGNYSSQFFANVYLNELDQFVKRKLGCRHYVRYVDDFILLSRNPEELRLWRDEINSFLQKRLKLELNPKKTRIQPLEKGVDFLGYYIKPGHTLVRQKVVKKLKRKLAGYNRELGEGCTAQEKIRETLSCINSYYGHFGHANSRSLRKHLYDKHFGILKKFLYPANKEYTHFRVRRNPSRPSSGTI